jgi:hypothetical protein
MKGKNMKKEDLMSKLERVERQVYTSCQMISDLRVLICGLYDEKEAWKKLYYEQDLEADVESTLEHYKDYQHPY